MDKNTCAYDLDISDIQYAYKVGKVAGHLELFQVGGHKEGTPK